VEIREMDGEQTRYVYIDDLDTGFTRYGRPESWISVNDSQEGTYKRHAYLMVTSALSGETFCPMAGRGFPLRETTRCSPISPGRRVLILSPLSSGIMCSIREE
jgi:hypothetical protein